MSTILFFGLEIFVLADDQFLRIAAISFIAAQSVLSYFIAGVAKAISPKWRSGTALREVLGTRSYGDASVARTLSSLPPSVNKAFCWVVITVESSFPLALILPLPLCLPFLAWGVAFHLLNAKIMGLNTFLWAFTATYPCILLVNHYLEITRW